MRYYNEHLCFNCEKELSIEEKMFSDGRCPRCGWKSPLAGTVCKTIERGYRLQTTGKWWQFWKKPIRVYDAEQ